MKQIVVYISVVYIHKRIILRRNPRWFIDFVILLVIRGHQEAF